MAFSAHYVYTRRIHLCRYERRGPHLFSRDHEIRGRKESCISASSCLLYCILCRWSYNVALILILSAAAPPLSTIPILVKRQNGNMQITNQFLVGSFLFSIISMPLMIMLLGMVVKPLICGFEFVCWYPLENKHTKYFHYDSLLPDYRRCGTLLWL